MKFNEKYDVFWLIGGGIGNIIESLYSIEYCLMQNLKVGILIESCPESFYKYIKLCYGHIIINLEDLKTINFKTRVLIHSWLFLSEHKIDYDSYFYINPDSIATQYNSETEMYLSVVKALFPSDYYSNTLKLLLEEKPQKIIKSEIVNKFVLYPGCSANDPSRRWPHYLTLIKMLGENNSIIIGGKDDLDFSMSYVYPNLISKIMPQQVLNRKNFWSICKKLGFLKKHSHLNAINQNLYSYFDYFSWREMCYIFKNSIGFVGNDGGLSHFAAASGSKGVVIFGPTSSNKSRPFNKNMVTLSLNYDCQPCLFMKKSIFLYKSVGFINCPYNVKCMNNIGANEIIDKLYEQLNYKTV